MRKLALEKMPKVSKAGVETYIIKVESLFFYCLWFPRITAVLNLTWTTLSWSTFLIVSPVITILEHISSLIHPALFISLVISSLSLLSEMPGPFLSTVQSLFIPPWQIWHSPLYIVHLTTQAIQISSLKNNFWHMLSILLFWHCYNLIVKHPTMQNVLPCDGNFVTQAVRAIHVSRSGRSV